jgi:hypothetical protein
VTNPRTPGGGLTRTDGNPSPVASRRSPSYAFATTTAQLGTEIPVQVRAGGTDSEKWQVEKDAERGRPS